MSKTTRFLIVLLIWMQIWRLAQYAGQIHSTGLLVTAIFFAYLMCVVFFPAFKSKPMEDLDDE
jgi:glycopeptide antibiotics resistance protein